jgi:HSP20 family protein
MAKSLIRWDPASELTSLRDSMDRLMDRLWREDLSRPLMSLAPFFGGASPSLDMYETDDAIVVEAVIPGVKPEEIDVQIVGSTLTIKGERKEEKKREEAAFVYQERRYGSFSRSITLPTEVDVDEAKAEFEHGILTLNLPKSEVVKPKSIKIKTK